MGRKLYREYDKETGELIKLECSKCHEIKIANCFSKNKSKKDGVQSQCKQCRSEIERQYHKNNKEKISEKRHQYYENNREEILERTRQWNENNKEKRYYYIRQWYENNKEKICEKNRQYRENHKEEERERIRQYRENHIEEERERNRQWRENHKEEIREYRENHKEERSKYNRQWYENKTQQEMMKIYENVTKQRYPHNGVQYGVIYGVACKVTNRWYIGQTTTSFNTRYKGDFFNCKYNELSEDNSKGQLLADDIGKYGQENFQIFEVLDVAFSEKELDEKEAYYIDLYKAYDEGYNSCRGNIFKHGKTKRRNNDEIHE